MDFCVHYVKDTGRIEQIESWMFERDPAPFSADHDFLLTTELAKIQDSCVINGTVQPKSPLDLSYSVNGLSVVFTALPVGAIVEVQSQLITVDADPTEITFDIGGVYKFNIIQAPLHQDETVEVTVNG